MALSRTDFRARFPEFATAADAIIDACLAEALLQTPSDVWGTKADAAQGLLTAHLLAISPFGRTAKLVSSKGDSTYGQRRREMTRALAAGCRVT